jgi:hypothetical protein
MEEHAEAPVNEITLELLPSPAASAIAGGLRVGVGNG